MKRLELKGVRTGYGTVEILHGVDLTVPKGRSVALLGANGAGKTTLLKAVAGLLRTNGGEILLGGQKIDKLSNHDRSRQGLCLIPEGRGIFPALTVRENLAMFCRGKAIAQGVERAAAAFPKLGDRLGQQAGTLSGGEQQMLAFARALITNPQVILADELSWGLAPVIVDEIFDAVRALADQGCSLLLVEQYVDRVLSVVDYVYVLHKGTVVLVAQPNQCRGNVLFEQYLGSVA